MHPELGMEIVREEPANVADSSERILPGILEGRNKLIEIALVAISRHFDQYLVIVICNERVSRALNPELMERRAYL